VPASGTLESPKKERKIMNEMLQKLIPVLIPLAVIAFGVAVAALLDLRKQTATRGPKWMWALFICVTITSFIGPLVYFVVGRKEE
jgi:uncharacterized membrane protein